jgi:hypothetical protein
MPETVTDIVIDASVDKVWRVLSDFSVYPAWNPYIRRMSGSLATGAALSVTRLQPDRGESTRRPTVTLYRPGREFRLLDRPMLPGLLDVEHGLKLEPLGPEQVRFIHWQTTSGLLAPILGGSSGEKLRGQLEAMNVALKGMVEAGLLIDVMAAGSADTAETSGFDERQPAVGQPA